MSPDPTRLGGLAWTRRTGGRLTRGERMRLLGEIAKGQAVNLAGRARLAAGRLPAGAAEIDARDFAPPDSALAREAEQACAELPAAIAGHSYRTWMFGLALAALDGSHPDPELGCYVQWGAMVDVAGLRLWDVSPANREEILRRHPRQAGFKTELVDAVRAEARAVPGGRFALLTRCGLPPAIRLAPFRP